MSNLSKMGNIIGLIKHYTVKSPLGDQLFHMWPSVIKNIALRPPNQMP